jgi:hypothetical protein
VGDLQGQDLQGQGFTGTGYEFRDLPGIYRDRIRQGFTRDFRDLQGFTGTGYELPYFVIRQKAPDLPGENCPALAATHSAAADDSQMRGHGDAGGDLDRKARSNH